MTINVKGYDVLIDEEDWERLKHYRFVIVKSATKFYIRFYYNKKYIRLHRFIMNCPDNKQVDHINGNTFDNRKCNLRICTNKENSCNSKIRKRNKSGFKGIVFYKSINKWKAKIQINGKQIHLGYFPTSEDAHAAYCEAAKKYHGEFARFE